MSGALRRSTVSTTDWRQILHLCGHLMTPGSNNVAFPKRFLQTCRAPFNVSVPGKPRTLHLAGYVGSQFHFCDKPTICPSGLKQPNQNVINISFRIFQELTASASGYFAQHHAFELP